jgi:NTP pyrophosphatase (non-canonical NTP hydrolase)
MDAIFEQLTGRLLEFRDARDWRQFHGLKNLMLSLNLEAAELLELAQWRDDAEIEAAIEDPEFRARLGEECADVLLYLLLICERAGIDLGRAADAKITRNGEKYPVEKSRGNSRKYTEL